MNPQDTAQIVPFNYDGAQLRTITRNGEPWFVAPDACRMLDLRDTSSALKMVDDDDKESLRRSDTPQFFGGIAPQVQMLTIVNESGMWALIFQSNKDQARKVRRWITREVLPSIRKTGGYIDPAASERQMNALIFQARAQIELCQAAKGLIHADHLEAKARVVLARGLGEHAELDQTRKPLYTQTFLGEKNLSKSKMRSVAGVFGKRVKKAYTELHGEPPRQYPLDLSNGQVRQVNAYTEADRPLMQRVWEENYAEQGGAGMNTFDAPRPDCGFDDTGERHVQREFVVRMRVDETDEWIDVPLRSVFVSDGLTGWQFEIGPYSISGPDARQLANSIADFGALSREFHPAGGAA